MWFASMSNKCVMTTSEWSDFLSGSNTMARAEEAKEHVEPPRLLRCFFFFVQTIELTCGDIKSLVVLNHEDFITNVNHEEEWRKYFRPLLKLNNKVLTSSCEAQSAKTKRLNGKQQEKEGNEQSWLPLCFVF